MYDTGGKDVFGAPIIVDEYKNSTAFEKCISYKLSQLGFSTKDQVIIGNKGVSFSDYIIDTILDENILVEVKLQNTGGTAENKLAYEMWTLQYACDHSNLYEKGYIIYGGTGFTRSVLTNLHEIVKMYSKVELIKYENDKTLSIIRNEI